MKTRALWLMTSWIAGLGLVSATAGCTKEPNPPAVSAAAKAAADKVVAEKAAADKVVADRAVADKAVADLLASQKAAADKAALAKAAAEASAAQKAVADEAALKKATAAIAVAEEAAAAKAVSSKVAADKAAAEKAAAEAASLPADLVVMKAEITRSLAQIDFTMAKLDALAISTGDLKEPSQGAVDAIQALDTETQGVKKRADDMRNRGAAYFEDWEKQLAAMSTPEVMAIAAKRKNELAAKYAEVLTAMQESRAAFDPYWTDMMAIRKAVEDGLTPETLKAFAPKVKAAREKATTLMTRVEVASAKLNQVGVIYAKP